MGATTDLEKFKLAMEICFISKRVVWCAHSRIARRAPFVDWYLILGVDENSGLDVIRKRYHKLALQLHPDKNKHPKAEFAFKLVSEAHACLSDSARRKAFNSEKLRNFCWECKRVPYVTVAQDPTTPNAAPRPNSRRTLHGLEEIKVRLMEEARVIENCLRANAVLRRELPHSVSHQLSGEPFEGKHDGLGAKKESPVFDPSNYVLDGYPHMRTRVKNTNLGEFWSFRGIENKMGDSPIFMGKTGSGLPRSSRSSQARS
ncbi:hypothetical protein SAY86_010743 [Trapa natans]|uniref:J domain-containing protein n=1 Tax=Trapa natans TaxID=22666 RepID=A0AAN7LSS0_TRANT|nr:hypothetical protein SAY86_010743 [Trapa natans]